MIHVFLNASHSANSNNFQALFRRCITTKIWVETQTNPCIGVMHYVAVGQVALRVFGLFLCIIFSVMLHIHPVICLRCYGTLLIDIVKLHVDTHRHTQTDTHRHTDTQTDTHTDTHTHSRTDTHTHTFTHRHTHTQTHTHTHTHTHTIFRVSVLAGVSIRDLSYYFFSTVKLSLCTCFHP